MANKDVIEVIRENYEQLFSAEKKVANYILNHPEQVPMLNVSDLAACSKTSEATVVRMCKHLSFDGYYQMRLLLSRNLGKNDQHAIISEDDSVQRLFAYEIKRLAQLANSVRQEDLIQAARLILQAKIVHIIGVGNTVPIVMDLGFRLERNGIRCMYNALPELFYNHLSLGDENDVVIAYSRSGSSKQVLRAVDFAKKKGMRVIVVTGELNKQFIENADCVIHVVERDTLNSYVTKPDSHLLEYAVNDALITVVRNLRDVKENSGDSEIKEEEIERLLSEFKL